MKQFFLIILLLVNTICGFAQWNMNTAVNLEVAALNVADLQTANTTDGKTWIAFYNNNAGNYDMRAQLLDAAGNKLLGADGILVCSQPSGSATFVFNVCLDASNNLLIAFQYEVAGVNSAVITKVNTDGSLPWGNNGVVLGAGLAPYPAVLTTGETVVAWNNNSPSTLYIQKISAAGTIVWGLPVAITVGASLTTRGQIVANPNGFFTMVFQKRGVGISTTLYAQRYNNDGTAQWASAVQLSALTTSGARYYSIVGDGDITYFGYYAASGSRFFSYVQRINANGALPWGEVGAPFSTYSTGADPYQQTTNIAHYPGSAYIWAVCTYSNTLQSQYGVYIQKFNTSDGSVLLDPLGKEVYPISNNMDTQTGALAFYSEQTPLFISYDVNYKIRLTVLDNAGNFVNWNGFPYEMSSTTATLATPKGRFGFNYSSQNSQAVAVWYENRGTEYRAYAQNRNLTIIPVTLADFKASKESKKINLSWNTVTEINNTGFYVERSADGRQFKSLNFVPTKATGGNSNLNLDYVFTDMQPLAALNYYRLKQVDLDGKYSYSKTVLVRFDKTGSFYINSIYPKPATSVLHVSVGSGAGMKADLSIVDMNGKTIKSSAISLNKGNTVFDVDVSTFAKGIYFLKITGNEKEVSIEKWVRE